MPARSIAGSAFAARWSGRGGEGCRARARGRARLHRAHAANLGGDLDRRRSVGAVAAPPQGRDGALAAIDHVKVIRVHTRVPSGGAGADHARSGEGAAYRQGDLRRPARQSRARTDRSEARAACARFIDAGIPMLSQSVLLRGVNDDAETLGALMRSLGRVPDQAVLSAPRRSRARHGAFPHHDCARARR